VGGEVLAAEVGVVLHGRVPAFAELGGEADSSEDAVASGLAGGGVEAGAFAAVERRADVAGIVEEFVLLEDAEFRDQADVRGEVDGVGDASAQGGAEAVDVLTVDSEVEAVGVLLCEGGDAQVGVLGPGDGAEGELPSGPVLAEVECAADLAALLVAAGHGGEADRSADAGAAEATGEDAVGVKAVVGVAGVGAEEGGVNDGGAAAVVVGVGAWVAVDREGAGAVAGREGSAVGDVADDESVAAKECAGSDVDAAGRLEDAVDEECAGFDGGAAADGEAITGDEGAASGFAEVVGSAEEIAGEEAGATEGVEFAAGGGEGVEDLE
jgi:hypothetical protein